jgi:ABC-2 type transport system ATP-binding protein
VAPTATAIEAAGLQKSYGKRLVLRDVSFSVGVGEVVGLLGPNGAGKTTTLSILATLLAPDQGKVLVTGLDVRRERHAVRRKLGLVPQSLALYPALSVLENAQLFGRIHGLSAAQARAAAMRALKEVQLAERARDAVRTLSGGMKRRLNLACALVHSPEVLLLDEPSVGVDPQSRQKILETVREIARAGATAIYSTHYMEEVEELCDRVFLIDRGQVVAAGTVVELIAKAGGHPRIEMTFQGRAPRNWYSDLPGVSEIATSVGDNRLELQFAALGQVAELLERARLAGGIVLEFSVHSPNLSDAFIALTGHALRDGIAEPD